VDAPAATRDRLIEQHLPLVRAIARRYAGTGEPMDDLVQVGAIGLIKAIDRFDPERGSRLEPYAAAAIGGEIRHHLRDLCAPVRLPRRLHDDGVRVRFEPLEESELPCGRDSVAAADDRLAIACALRSLQPRSRRLLALCFLADLSQAQAARALGISTVQASRMLGEALGALRVELAEPPAAPLTGAVAAVGRPA
jgi:RNA polymerase sigma-B factor